MFAPEEQQIEICLLKSNLVEIENDFVAQRAALPAMVAENNQKYHETMIALQALRCLKTDIEKLKLENVKLTAIRIQLKQQSDEIAKNLKTALENREKLKEERNQEEQDIKKQSCIYEDSLQEKAERFRKSRGYYNEEEINTKIDEVNSLIAELKDDLSNKQSSVDELKAQMDSIRPVVPENLLEKIGKLELEEKVNTLTKQYEDLLEKRKSLAE